MRGKDYRYHADFMELFPESLPGMSAFVWGTFISPVDTTLKFTLIPYGPAVVYLNGQEIARTDIFSERDAGTEVPVNVAMKTGKNHLIIKFTCTPAGFGGEFGTWLGKLDYYFLKPLPDCHDEEGVVYCRPFPDTDREAIGISYLDTHEIDWLPRRTWKAEDVEKGQFGRIFGHRPGLSAVARTIGNFSSAGDGDYIFSGTHNGSLSIRVGRDLVFEKGGTGDFSFSCRIPTGRYPIIIAQTCTDSTWGFSLVVKEVIQKKDYQVSVEFENPLVRVEKTSAQPWIFCGPFKAGHESGMNIDVNPDQLWSSSDGLSYWRLDYPDGWIRQYNENPLFGHWNYPLGVTLYGLLETARVLGDCPSGQELGNYVQAHVRASVSNFPYAMWDKEQFGGATGVHHLLTSIDSLDDCGSFGSLMLEAAKDCDIGSGYKEIAAYVAHHILHEQSRLEDGIFFRKDLMHHFHNDTMWADDLYMSIPFLCRYAALSGDASLLDDAASQFIGFRKLLYDPVRRLMNHVYDFRRNMATGVAWGRGNGWTIFSLAELLEVIPREHDMRPELLDFFRNFADGLLAMQDSDGMWHQVLDVRESYPETSCTAMFIYAFSRGIRNGWLEEPLKFRCACELAWTALQKTSIDYHGNIHGVCRGSEFSFTPRYYAEELLPRLNDTHGIGIVLLAGVEMKKLRRHYM
ncbi:glycoside hydrolase family 88/105 protein [Parasphaerochaeta coccoides]|nr:glycoside hydrolase family 88 protein [Parasphaerochaeta coccoides]